MKRPGAHRPRGALSMNSRLIPWCLAATAFVVALAVSGWKGDPGGRDQLALPPAAVERWSTPPATDHPGWRSSRISAEAPAELENASRAQTLPLPSATQPELYSNSQSVPDDEPTVDDLPGRPDPSVPPTGGE